MTRISRTEQLENAQIAAAGVAAEAQRIREHLAALRASRKRQRNPFYRDNIDFQIGLNEARLVELEGVA